MAFVHVNQPQPNVDVRRMALRAHEASEFLKALAHESRLMILCDLLQGEKSVGELEALLERRQSSVSQQLARLRLEGLVAARRDGKTIYYSIASDKARRSSARCTIRSATRAAARNLVRSVRPPQAACACAGQREGGGAPKRNRRRMLRRASKRNRHESRAEGLADQPSRRLQAGRPAAALAAARCR